MKKVEKLISGAAMLVSALVLVGVSSPLLARGESSDTSDPGASCVRALANPTGDQVNACSSVSQEFSLECVTHWGNPNSDMIRACGQIASRDAADCVNALKVGNYDMIMACTGFDNSFAPRCVKEWQRPSSDLIRACGNIANPYALSCIDALTAGNPDVVNACASIKDQVGVDCLNNTQNKNSDSVRRCSLVSSLPDTNINCVHCTAEQRANNRKVFNENLKEMSAVYSQTMEKAKMALADKGFLSADQSNLMDLVHCELETMRMGEILLTYKERGEPAKVALPAAPTCEWIFKKYDAYLSANGH